MKRFSRLFFLTFPLAFGACVKGKNADPVVPTTKQLIAGNWQLQTYRADSIFTDAPDTQTTDVYALLPLCRKDDIFQFGTDEILLLQEGSQNCNPDLGPSVALGYWRLLAGNVKLVLDDPDLEGTTDTLALVGVNETQMNVAATRTFVLPNSTKTGTAKLQKTYNRKK